LIQLSHCYQDAGEAPGRAELLERQYPSDYVMPVITGWLSFKGLVRQAGIDYDTQIKKAQECMDRAMDDTND
jgi:hypothetical protein